MKREWILTIPDWTPVLTNHWYARHWRVRHRLKTEQTEFIAAYALSQRIPKARGRRSVSLKVWGWHRGRKPDRDAFDKLLLDSLVSCGLLTDDNEEGLEGRMQVEIIRSKEKRTEIVLRDAQEVA